MKRLLAASLCAGSLLLSAPLATASPISFGVIINTAALVGNPNAPFSLDFQLNDGTGSLTVPNTATLSNFVFTGGSATGSATQIGGVTGDLSGTVNMSDSANAFNEFFQAFTAGTTQIRFNVALSGNVEPVTPDLFSVSILDNTLANIFAPGLGNSVLFVSMDKANLGLADIHTFTSTDPSGVGVTATPEPASLLLLGSGLIGAGVRRWKQNKKAA